MKFHVITFCNHLEIRHVIVGSVKINVMNIVIRRKVTHAVNHNTVFVGEQKLFCYQPMLENKTVTIRKWMIWASDKNISIRRYSYIGLPNRILTSAIPIVRIILSKINFFPEFPKAFHRTAMWVRIVLFRWFYINQLTTNWAWKIIWIMFSSVLSFASLGAKMIFMG